MMQVTVNFQIITRVMTKPGNGYPRQRTMKPKRRRFVLLLALSLLALMFAGVRVGFQRRWYVAPYPPLGKNFAWSLGFAEAAYNFDVVIPGRVYRSAMPDARFVKYVHDVYGVAHIISLAGPSEAHEIAKTLGMQVTVFRWSEEHLGSPDEIAMILAAMDGKKPVLIHCQAGRHRTGFAVAIYRMRRQHWSLDQAVQEMKRYRHHPSSHPLIQAALLEQSQKSNSK